MEKVSSSRRLANDKWRYKNKERTQYLNYRSTARRFIIDRGEFEDLIMLKKLIDQRIVELTEVTHEQANE